MSQYTDGRGKALKQIHITESWCEDNDQSVKMKVGSQIVRKLQFGGDDKDENQGNETAQRIVQERQQLDCEQTYDSFNWIEGQDTEERYQYTIEILKEGEGYKIREFIREVDVSHERIDRLEQKAYLHYPETTQQILPPLLISQSPSLSAIIYYVPFNPLQPITNEFFFHIPHLLPKLNESNDHLLSPLKSHPFPQSSPQQADDFNQVNIVSHYQQMLWSALVSSISKCTAPIVTPLPSTNNVNFYFQEASPKRVKQQKQDISTPLQASSPSQFVIPANDSSSFPEELQFFFFTNATKLDPPPCEPNNAVSLNLNLNLKQTLIYKNFSNELPPSSAPNQIIDRIDLFQSNNGQQQQNPDEIQALLNSVQFPQKINTDLNIEQVQSEHKLVFNSLQASKIRNMDQIQVKSIKPKRSKPIISIQIQDKRKDIPFQQQLKFNIQKDFPKAWESQLKYLPQNDFSEASKYNSMSLPQHILPSRAWMEKQKQTPRMNFSYNQNEQRPSFQTPTYHHFKNESQEIRQEKILPSFGRNVKISLYSPKAPKLFSHEAKNQRLIKLQSHQKDLAHRSQEKAGSPYDTRQKQPNTSQLNNGSPKKQKLKLVQKPKPIISLKRLAPLNQIPISLPEPLKQERQSKSINRPSQFHHKQKIKITLRNPARIQRGLATDQSKIRIEYQQNQIPINQRVN